MSVTCFAPADRESYLSITIGWETYVTSLDDRSAHLDWDDEPTEFERWDGGGDWVSPQYSRTHRYDRAFISKLGQHSHLDFAVESVDGWHHAKFQLDGFTEAYRPVAAYCS